MDVNLDANKVVDYLTDEIAAKAKANAMLQTKIDFMQSIIDEQAEVINAYEEIESLEKGEVVDEHKGNRN